MPSVSYPIAARDATQPGCLVWILLLWGRKTGVWGHQNGGPPLDSSRLCFHFVAVIVGRCPSRGKGSWARWRRAWSRRGWLTGAPGYRLWQASHGARISTLGTWKQEGVSQTGIGLPSDTRARSYKSSWAQGPMVWNSILIYSLVKIK